MDIFRGVNSFDFYQTIDNDSNDQSNEQFLNNARTMRLAVWTLATDFNCVNGIHIGADAIACTIEKDTHSFNFFFFCLWLPYQLISITYILLSIYSDINHELQFKIIT